MAIRIDVVEGIRSVVIPLKWQEPLHFTEDLAILDHHIFGTKLVMHGNQFIRAIYVVLPEFTKFNPPPYFRTIKEIMNWVVVTENHGNLYAKVSFEVFRPQLIGATQICIGIEDFITRSLQFLSGGVTIGLKDFPEEFRKEFIERWIAALFSATKQELESIFPET